MCDDTSCPRHADPAQPAEQPTVSAADELLRLCDGPDRFIQGMGTQLDEYRALARALRVLVDATDKSLPRVQHTLESALAAARKTEG